MNFVTKSFRKDETLTSWPLLQHICPHFWAWLLLYSAITPKSEEKYVVKVFNWSEFHLSEMTLLPNPYFSIGNSTSISHKQGSLTTARKILCYFKVSDLISSILSWIKKLEVKAAHSDSIIIFLTLIFKTTTIQFCTWFFGQI